MIGSFTRMLVTFAYIAVPLTVKLPAIVVLPLTLSELSVPVLVMFGCAFVYTVPDTNAFPT